MATRKVALVTGSGKKRVGYHVSLALAERGYNLVIHYHCSAEEAKQTQNEIQGKGVAALSLGADLRNEQSVSALMRQVLDHFGRIDVLVNCAAVYTRKRLEEVTAEDVRLNLETNVLGTFLCCRQAGLTMVHQPEGGCIVNLGDWAQARPYLDFAAYFASKGAIPGMTRDLAVELGTRNPKVRVNCILPGPVLYPPDLPAEEREQSIAGTVVKHKGRTENIAQAVLFFIDNDFVTGVCLPVDGGRSIYAGPGTG
jgi:pteridine reductase